MFLAMALNWTEHTYCLHLQQSESWAFTGNVEYRPTFCCGSNAGRFNYKRMSFIIESRTSSSSRWTLRPIVNSVVRRRFWSHNGRQENSILNQIYVGDIRPAARMILMNCWTIKSVNAVFQRVSFSSSKAPGSSSIVVVVVAAAAFAVTIANRIFKRHLKAIRAQSQ